MTSATAGLAQKPARFALTVILVSLVLRMPHAAVGSTDDPVGLRHRPAITLKASAQVG